jgi:hypothetical protein
LTTSVPASPSCQRTATPFASTGRPHRTAHTPVIGRGRWVRPNF